MFLSTLLAIPNLELARIHFRALTSRCACQSSGGTDRMNTTLNGLKQRVSWTHQLVGRAFIRPNGDRGATLLEYGLLLLFVFLAALLTIQLFGDSLIPVFGRGADAINNAPGVHPTP